MRKITPRLGLGRWFPVRALAVLLALWATGTARAEDTVMLNDGKMYTGTIIGETDEAIEFETTIGTIPTTLKIDRGRIVSIVKGHRTWEPAQEPEEAGGTPHEARVGPAVMEIPIVGEFGSDVLPISFRAALDHARRQQVEHIILRIDSPGGAVWAARDILQQIEAARGEFAFHALVESAISAAIWPTFACDTIHIAPRGQMGGAVAYRATGRGSVEVDAKMNSIIAAEIVSVAEALGHDGDVIRAMILMPSELYARSVGDRIRLDGSRPTGPDERFEVVDGPTTVLTLTSNEAARLGVARPLDSATAEAMMRALRVERWISVDGSGIVERWALQCEKRRALARLSAEKLMAAYERAENTRDIDEAIAALTEFQREHPRFAKYYNELLECFPTDESIDPDKVKELTDAVREDIKELRRLKREGP